MDKSKFENESLNVLYETYEEIRRNILPKKDNVETLLDFFSDFTDLIYRLLHLEYEERHLIDKKIEEEIRKICSFVVNNLYPYFKKQIFDVFFDDINKYSENSEKRELIEKLSKVEDKLFSIMAFRSLKFFAFYIEREKNPKDRIWGKTMEIFEPFFYYANKMVLNQDVELIRASYFPGAGKTYAGNLLCAFWFGYDYNMSFLRITYSDDLTKSFTSQIKEIIKTKQYRTVFPKFDMDESDLFKPNQAKTFKFSFSKFYNFYSDTTSGKPTGKRAKCLIIDDVSKGIEEANNLDKHREIINKYDYNWTSRTDSDKMYKILLGTMWNANDLLNVVMQREQKYNNLYEDSYYKYTIVNNQNRNKVSIALISVPALDYNTDESTCPLRYSTSYFRKKRDDSEEETSFEAVYQQRPQDAEEIIFGYSKLLTYQDIVFEHDKRKVFETCAFLDPNRTGLNYVSLGFFRRYRKDDNTWTKWYLIDCVFQLKIIDDLIELIEGKIIKNRVDKIGIETNTDATLVRTLKKELGQKNYYPKFVSKYTTEKKEAKILAASWYMTHEIVYPDNNILATNRDLKDLMNQFISYNALGKNKYDDAPDMIAMFSEMVQQKNTSGKASFIDDARLRF